jgi:hypothetical protein
VRTAKKGGFKNNTVILNPNTLDELCNKHQTKPAGNDVVTVDGKVGENFSDGVS